MNEQILAHYSYDPITGIIIGKRGLPVGHLNPSGYLQVTFGGKCFQAHRLAWRLHTGEWPSDEIDHINRIKDDNRWANLRAANRYINTQNVGTRKDNKWGVKGISFDSRSQQWRVRRQRFGKSHNLGFYDDFFEACCAAIRFE